MEYLCATKKPQLRLRQPLTVQLDPTTNAGIAQRLKKKYWRYRNSPMLRV